MDYTVLAINMLVMSLIANIALALYGLIFRSNMIKKIISLTIFSDTASVMTIVVGYRFRGIP
ncbi:TPA: Na+/H+ antiporter subunit C, partial [Candidatus Micrarchaeota archaeon]|nr:Na+/H+ antiporter subunit C [Candidatus Micrarchaeota archaeon]